MSTGSHAGPAEPSGTAAGLLPEELVPETVPDGPARTAPQLPSPQARLDQAPTEYVRPRGVLHGVRTLPQNLAIALLRLYRRLVSPLYGDVCRFFPSCSAYALEAFTVHGAVRGLGLTVRRLLRCHPWAAGGLDPVPAGPRGLAPEAAPKILLLNNPRLAHVHDAPSAPGLGAHS